MLLRRKRTVPDHYRRAIRLSVAVLLLSAVAFPLVGRPGCEPYVMLLKWALLTCPVVTMPLLGKVSQVSFERALGTIIGGALGFWATALATHWWTLKPSETDDLLLAAMTGTAAFVSVLAGQRLSLDLSAKLFTIAFILVCFSSQEGRDPLVVACSRVGGIVTGVATMLIMSVLILPKSATVEALRTLCKALDKLQEVNDIAWGSYLPGEAQAAQLVAATAAQQHSSGGVIRQQQRQANGRPHGDDSAMSEPLLPPGDGDGDVESGQAWSGAALGLRLDSGCVSGMLPAELEVHELKSEKALTQLYAVLNQLAEQLALAKTEIWVSGCGGRPFLLPGLPFWHPHSTHLPWKGLEEVATAIRRVGRILNTAIYTFEDGFDQQLRSVLGPMYPVALLPTLAAGAHAAIQELCDAFSGEQQVGGTGLAAYSSAVQSLTAMSEQNRRRLAGAFKRHRSRAGARSSWANIIDSVLEEQRSQLDTMVQGMEGQVLAGEPAAPATQLQQAEAPAGAAGSGQGASSAVAAAGVAVVREDSKDYQREATLAGWLRRVSSGRIGGGSSGDIAAGAAAAIATVAKDEAPQQVSTNGEAGSRCSSPVKSASLAAAASQRRGLAEVPTAGGGGMGQHSAPPLLSRVSMLRQGAGVSFNTGGGMSLALFPDTTQGRLAQVSFFSFCLLV